jgi:hypothetical protein
MHLLKKHQKKLEVGKMHIAKEDLEQQHQRLITKVRLYPKITHKENLNKCKIYNLLSFWVKRAKLMLKATLVHTETNKWILTP